MKRIRKNGFTVIELVVVIVVIGVLAAVVTVVYGNVQREARNTTRLTELRSWIDIFEVYKARKGSYPGKNYTVSTGGCLGAGFPHSTDDANYRCRETHVNEGYSYTEAESTALMADLMTVAKMPPADKTPVAGWLVGPWVEFEPATNEIWVSTAIDSRNPKDCTKAGFRSAWIDAGSGAQICSRQFYPAW